MEPFLPLIYENPWIGLCMTRGPTCIPQDIIRLDMGTPHTGPPVLVPTYVLTGATSANGIYQ